MRLRAWLLSLACCGGGVLAACGGSKHPPPPAEVPDRQQPVGEDDSGVVVDAGPAPKFCLDVPEGGVPPDCSCSITEGMWTLPLACGYAICTNLTTTVQLCGYDGKIKIIPNVPFSDCAQDAGIPPCTPASDAGSSDAGSSDAGSSDASADADDAG